MINKKLVLKNISIALFAFLTFFTFNTASATDVEIITAPSGDIERDYQVNLAPAETSKNLTFQFDQNDVAIAANTTVNLNAGGTCTIAKSSVSGFIAQFVTIDFNDFSGHATELEFYEISASTGAESLLDRTNVSIAGRTGPDISVVGEPLQTNNPGVLIDGQKAGNTNASIYPINNGTVTFNLGAPRVLNRVAISLTSGSGSFNPTFHFKDSAGGASRASVAYADADNGTTANNNGLQNPQPGVLATGSAHVPDRTLASCTYEATDGLTTRKNTSALAVTKFNTTPTSAAGGAFSFTSKNITPTIAISGYAEDATAPKIVRLESSKAALTASDRTTNLTFEYNQGGLTKSADLSANFNTNSACTISGNLTNASRTVKSVFMDFTNNASPRLNEIEFYNGTTKLTGVTATTVQAIAPTGSVGNLVDGNNATSYIINGTGGQVRFDFATAQKMDKIRFNIASTNTVEMVFYFSNSSSASPSNYDSKFSAGKNFAGTAGAKDLNLSQIQTSACSYTIPATGSSQTALTMTSVGSPTNITNASGTSLTSASLQAVSGTNSSAVTVKYQPEITVTSPNTDPAVEKLVSATDDINPPATSTWNYKLIDGTATCDATAFSGGAPIHYTEGDDIPLNTEDRNGQKVCFSSTDGGATGYAASAVIGGIDRTSPVISISGPSADTVVSDSFTITVTEINPNASTFKYSYVEDAATCNASITTAPALAFTSGTAISENTEANNGKYICAVATDVLGNTTYKSSANVININVAPTDISLSSNTVIENKAEELVGTFSAVDGSTNNTYTYSFIAGTGDTNNSDFTISGNEIKTLNSTDFETKDTYSVRVNVNDGLSDIEKVFEIKIIDGLDSRSIRTSSSSSSTKKVCKDDRASNYEKDGLHRQDLCEYGNNIVLEVKSAEDTTETVVNVTSDQINVDKVRQELVLQIEDLISEILRKLISRLTSELAS